MREGNRAYIAVVMAIWIAACSGGGDEPTAKPSGLSMQPSASSQGIDLTASTGSDEAPQIQSVRLDPEGPKAGTAVSARVEASAADTNQVQFDFEWTVGGTRRAEHGPRIPIGHGRKGDTIEVVVVARDRNGASEPFRTTTTVQNTRPSIRDISVDPAGRIPAGNEATAHPNGAEDADGDPLDFQYTWWVNGRLSDVRGPAFSTEGLRRGDQLQVQVIASDGQEESEPVQSRKIKIANGAPVIVSEPGGADEDGVFRYRVKAEDPDGDRGLRYSLAEAPEGMTITASYGSIEWRPRQDQGGTHTIEVLVEDADGGQGGQRFAVSVDTSDPAAEQVAPPASPATHLGSSENPSGSRH